jgi:hypothetical protein
MFKWLKGRASAQPSSQKPADRRAAPAVRKAAAATAPPPFAPSAPLPEVIGEGSTEADWSAWEDSMTTLDSQMQELVPSQRVYVRDTRPSQLDELDPFASVRRKRG